MHVSWILRTFSIIGMGLAIVIIVLTEGDDGQPPLESFRGDHAITEIDNIAGVARYWTMMCHVRGIEDACLVGGAAFGPGVATLVNVLTVEDSGGGGVASVGGCN